MEKYIAVALGGAVGALCRMALGYDRTIRKGELLSVWYGRS